MVENDKIYDFIVFPKTIETYSGYKPILVFISAGIIMLIIFGIFILLLIGHTDGIL